MATHECYFCSTLIKSTVNNCPQCGQPQFMQGKYRLVRLLGQGGFGIVYEALDTRLNRRYAVKSITTSSSAQQKQVEAEANILAQHARQFPFMPEVYDIWSDGPRTVLVMEYVDGPTLGDLLAEHGSWPAAEVEAFLRTMLTHLDQLHEAGIIHRDLKPDNIKRTTKGRFVLLDFGIAKQSGGTLTGAKALSPYYSPPEQARGLPTDARSDLYSLGATAYHLLTGQPPAPGEFRDGMAMPLIPPSDKVDHVPASLEAALLKLLELDAANRPENAQAALQLLDQPASHLRVLPQTRAAAQVGSQVEHSPATIRVPSSDPAPAPEIVKPRRNVSMWVKIAAVQAILLLAIIFGLRFFRDNSQATDQLPNNDSPPTPTSEPMVARATQPPIAAANPAATAPAETDDSASSEAPEKITIIASLPIKTPEGEATANGYTRRQPEEVKICDTEVDFKILDSANGADLWGNEEANAAQAIKDKALIYLTTYDTDALHKTIRTLNEHQIPVISSVASEPGLTKPELAEQDELERYYPYNERNFIRIMPTDELQGSLGATWAQKLGVTTVFIVGDESRLSEQIASHFQSRVDKLGITVLGRVRLAPVSQANQELLKQIHDAHADLIYFSGGDQESIANLLHALNDPLSGQRPRLMATDQLFNPDFISRAGPAAEGMYLTATPMEPQQLGEDVVRWTTSYTTEFKLQPTFQALYGYEAMSLAVAALDESCDNLTPKNVRDKLFATENFPGLLGTWSIDDNGDTTLQAISGYQIKDGVFAFQSILTPDR